MGGRRGVRERCTSRLSAPSETANLPGAMKNAALRPIARYASLFLVLSLAPGFGLAAEDKLSARDIFERRIKPIFESPDPSSCMECHLAGVDLKNYILPSHEKTFVSLRDQGLIDLENPAGSKILRFISMGAAEGSGVKLIDERVRRAEREAFAAWIEASCADEKLRAAPRLAPKELAKPKRPDAVIRHARADRLLASFEDTIWAQRFRCAGCHLAGGSENAKLVKEHGDKVNWMQPEGAAATMEYLLSSSLIDKKSPEKSLFLRKPLNEVKHGGGQKMIPGDLGYKAWRTWIDDTVRTLNDDYAAAADLPKQAAAPDAFMTEIWLKLAKTPPEWGDKLAQVTVFAWDGARKAWEREPIAITDRVVWGKGKLWQHSLLLLTEKGSPRAAEWKKGKASLPEGRYLLRVHVDAAGRMQKEWKKPFGDREYVGETVIESRWPSGYNRMTVVEAATVKKVR